MDIIQEYQQEKINFEKAHREKLEGEIRQLLMLLEEGEFVELDSNNCDGAGIMVGTYTDTINRVNKDGSCIVYNNTDCDSMGLAYDNGDVFGFPLEVTTEILKCIRIHVRKKQGVITDNLNSAMRTLDKAQNLIESLYGNGSEYYKKLYEARCSIQDIKDDIKDENPS